MIGHRSGPTRHGFTLIDTVVVIFIGSVLMYATLLLVMRLLTVAPAAQQQLEQRMTLDRLAAQLRRDAHAAGSAALEKNQSNLILRRVGELDVQYAIADAAVDRTATRDGKTESRDRFRLPASKAQWRFDPKASPPDLALIINKTTGLDQKPVGTNFEIHAVVGRDQQVTSQ